MHEEAAAGVKVLCDVLCQSLSVRRVHLPVCMSEASDEA